MGAKQSKRSVDISGKEAESAGEVAASIAGGEGRVEQLADADALKPQLNGDVHIHEPEEKLKDIDSGTPENEKDATTEKEAKQQEEEKEVAPLTNGESEQKVENGESTPIAEDGKKPKKEKVKKKWSLRSISFSRKDKPKQEKKQKEEEPKTNGEPEKVPEETAEAAPEVPAVTETAEEAKTQSELKEDKTPETPVTEPITNGSSTSESPKIETPVIEEPAAPSPESEKVEPKAETEPEQLPVNGLSLEEPAKEITENEKNEDSKEKPTTEKTEIAPEISVKKEVCVEQMPLIDSTPPPLPANPPPSSVASFAATTMAPELTDASLANTADNAISPTPPSDLIANKLDIIPPEPETELTVTKTVSNELSPPLKEVNDETLVSIRENCVQSGIKDTVENIVAAERGIPVVVENVMVVSDTIEKSVTEENTIEKSNIIIPAPTSSSSELIEKTAIDSLESEQMMPSPPSEVVETVQVCLKETPYSENNQLEMPSPPSELVEETAIVQEKEYSQNIELAMHALSSELVQPTIVQNNEILPNVEPALPAPPTEITEEQAIEEREISENYELAMPSPPSELVEEPAILQDKELCDNDERAMPIPPSELLEELLTNNRNSDNLSASPMEPAESLAEPIAAITIANEELTVSVKAETPAPLAEDSVVIDANTVILNNVEDLPSPPTPICDDVVTDENVDTLETINEINNISINSNHVFDAKDILCEQSELQNDNEDLEKKLKSKSKDSLGNLIEPRECNGNIGGEKETTEIIAPTNGEEIAREDPEPPRAAPAATLQEPLQVTDKLADLIPEVPEVPELKTETLQETTSDVAVAN